MENGLWLEVSSFANIEDYEQEMKDRGICIECQGYGQDWEDGSQCNDCKGTGKRS
jgi:DnaJ-class molecular chaperone